MQPTTHAEREEQRKAASERGKARRLWRRDSLARVSGGESRVGDRRRDGRMPLALQYEKFERETLETMREEY